MNDFITLASKRFSCRSFSDKPIEDEKLKLILEAGRSAPTAKNGQPYFIYAVKSAEMREKLKSVSPCTFNAPVIFVMCGDVASSWKDPYTGRPRAEMDVSIVTTHMMLEAADLGLGTTWVCMFNPHKLHTLLELPDNHYPYCLLPTGYPAPDAVPSPRHADRRETDIFVKTI